MLKKLKNWRFVLENLLFQLAIIIVLSLEFDLLFNKYVKILLKRYFLTKEKDKTFLIFKVNRLNLSTYFNSINILFSTKWTENFSNVLWNFSRFSKCDLFFFCRLINLVCQKSIILWSMMPCCKWGI